MTSPVEIAEPLEGITDAIQAAREFIVWADAVRDRPGNGRYQQEEYNARNLLIVRLRALK